MINHTGSCICGAIEFTVDIDEKPRVFNCHCIDCRKKVGGIITIIQLRDNALKIDENKYVTSSMRDRSIYFFELDKQEKIINFDRLEVLERVRDLKFYENKLYLFLEDTASIGIIDLI